MVRAQSVAFDSGNVWLAQPPLAGAPRDARGLHCLDMQADGSVGFKLRKRWLVLLIFGASTLAGGQQVNRSSVASIEALIRSHNYDQALAATRSALQQAPKDFRLWTLDGIVCSLMGNSRDAINAFDQALLLSPSYAPALKGEVQLLYQTHDKRAIPLLERILKADPKDEVAHEMLATLEAGQANCQAANENFLASAAGISSHPDSLEAYGKCLVQTKQLEKAVPVFEKVVALLPDRTYPQYDLAVVLVETKRYESALKTMGPLLKASQPDPDVLSLASEAYEATGDTPKAVSLLRQAIVLDPANASYYSAFAALCLNHESYQVGVDMLNIGLKHVSNDPSLYISRGLLYAQLAQYDLAEEDFKAAERLDSSQSISSYAIDLAELQRNHPDQALAEIHTQLKAHPQSPLLNYLLGKMLWSQGSDEDKKIPAEAMRSVQLALKLKPDMVEARDLLANMYMRSGQYSLAVEQCRLVLEYAPSDQSAIYHLITALRHSGQEEQHKEIPALLKRLSELQQSSLQQETDRKRFKLVEAEAPSAKQND